MSLNNSRLSLGFPGSSDGKESTCNERNVDSVPRMGRSPGEGNGYSLQYSFLENSMDRGASWATVQGVAKSWTQLRLTFSLLSLIVGKYLISFIFFVGYLLLGRKAMTNLDSILKSRHQFADKGQYKQSYGFPSSHVHI